MSTAWGFPELAHRRLARCRTARTAIWLLLLTQLSLVWGPAAQPLASPDSGPHLDSGWEQTIRFLYLYTEHSKGSASSWHLQINQDGTVGGSGERSLYSLLEMRAVAPGVVAIKGYLSGRYLCMERDGRLLGSLTYNEADCSFKERLLSGTYNLYWSEKYGAAVSLSNRRQRGHTRGRAFPPLSQFLPIRNTQPIPPVPGDQSRDIPELDSLPSSVIQINSMDPLDFTYEAT
ncbi:fibroblast growth factor 19 [Rhincodon typus]|uniref:fibroblast growth factor 19 n=1 Tax=Rhincodon typus TaxID=259920 RepID=UPI0009A368A0|nr:fibroblast growth factor 19 [Rhincodon typus]